MVELFDNDALRRQLTTAGAEVAPSLIEDGAIDNLESLLTAGRTNSEGSIDRR